MRLASRRSLRHKADMADLDSSFPTDSVLVSVGERFRLGRFAAAATLLERAYSEGHGSLESLTRGVRALVRGNAFAAVAELERAARISPDFPGLAEVLASAYRRDARYGDALAWAARCRPASRQGWFESGAAWAALGEAEKSLAAYDAALALDSGHGASWVGSAAPALDLVGVGAALERLERGLDCPGVNGKSWGLVAALHRLRGDPVRAEEVVAARIGDDPRRRPLIDGVRALDGSYSHDCRLFGLSAATLRHALSLAQRPGLVLEFGVRRGTSIAVLAQAARQAVHGFDSFEGLPEGWGSAPAGVLTTGAQIPEVPDSVTLHPGWFEDTLPGFLADHDEPVRLVNIDSDIYSSACTVLTALTPRLGPGAILVFDEFIGNRRWDQDEYRAFHEWAGRTGARWDVAAVGPFTKQVVIRLL